MMNFLNSGIKDLWAAVDSPAPGTSVGELRRRTFELARVLLAAVTPEVGQVASMDKDDLTDLLLECQLVCEAGKKFFEVSLPHIDPEYSGKPLEEQLQALEQALGVCVAEISRIQTERQELLAGEESLREQQARLDQLIGRVGELEEIGRRVQPEEVSKRLKGAGELESELMQQTIEALSTLVNKLSPSPHSIHLTANKEIATALGKSGVNLPSSLGELQRRIADELVQFDSELKRLIDQRDGLAAQLASRQAVDADAAARP